MNWTAVGAILMALAVAMGAFGAHGLRNRLDAYSMSVYEKAVFYHFVHALGILIIAVLARTGTFPLASEARGVVVFVDRHHYLLRQPVCAGGDGHSDAGGNYSDRWVGVYCGLGAAGVLCNPGARDLALVLCVLDLHDGAAAQAVREVVAIDDFRADAMFAGFGEFFFHVGTFV